MPGCKKNYTTEISVNERYPFGMFAQQNYPDGWVDPICLMCSNVDETKTIDIEIDQLSCTASKNCPNSKDLVPAKVDAGTCKNQLTPIKNDFTQKKIIIPYNYRENPLYTNLNAMTYFLNEKPEICPIVHCNLMMPGCKTPYTEKISIDGRPPFGIFAQQNNPLGWRGVVCLLCKNQDTTVTNEFTID